MNMATPFIRTLQERGWKFTAPSHGEAWQLPARYPVPLNDLLLFIQSFALLCNEEETAWFISARDYKLSGVDGFAWNEFEQMSLAAAEGDVAWVSRIKEFWTAHLPVFMRVDGHYSYAAYCFSGSNKGRYVCGSEPEFEEVTVVGSTLEEFQSWVLGTRKT
jgi:hypothetical protein